MVDDGWTLRFINLQDYLSILYLCICSYIAICSLSVCNLCIGCVSKEESSEEWLMKNFGAFRAMAQMDDLSTLNMAFSGVSFSSRFIGFATLQQQIEESFCFVQVKQCSFKSITALIASTQYIALSHFYLNLTFLSSFSLLVSLVFFSATVGGS